MQINMDSGTSGLGTNQPHQRGDALRPMGFGHCVISTCISHLTDSVASGFRRLWTYQQVDRSENVHVYIIRSGCCSDQFSEVECLLATFWRKEMAQTTTLQLTSLAGLYEVYTTPLVYGRMCVSWVHDCAILIKHCRPRPRMTSATRQSFAGPTFCLWHRWQAGGCDTRFSFVAVEWLGEWTMIFPFFFPLDAVA